jgi:hypothetical protein
MHVFGVSESSKSMLNVTIGGVATFKSSVSFMATSIGLGATSLFSAV